MALRYSHGTWEGREGHTDSRLTHRHTCSTVYCIAGTLFGGGVQMQTFNMQFVGILGACIAIHHVISLFPDHYMYVYCIARTLFFWWGVIFHSRLSNANN